MPARTRAAWLDEGVVLAGNWESLCRYVRPRGDDLGLIRARYAAARSEDTVRRLKDRGVTLVIDPLYVGQGVAAERDEMERTRAHAELLRKHGLRVGVYIQTMSSLWSETFFQEVPEARAWVSRDAEGRIPRYGELYFRYIACPTCLEYEAYVREHVFTFALHEVGADLIHLDNFRWWPEPEACRCARCAAAFRAYLETAWSDPEDRFARFGLTDFSHVEPPLFHWTRPPWKTRVLGDPVHRAWTDFKCRWLADSFRRYAEFARAIKPDVVMEHNADIKPGANSALNRGAWARWLDVHGDVHWVESRDRSGLRPAVARQEEPDQVRPLVTRIRGYKAAQATGNLGFNYSATDIEQAEALAFNQGCLGMVGWVHAFVDNEGAPPRSPFVSFLHANVDRLVGAESAAEVAVLYGYPSLCYACVEPHRELVLAEQVLIEHRIPYDVLYDDDLDRLDQYRVLVLPGTQLLAEAQARTISAWTRAGGGLVLTEQAGWFTDASTRRPRPVFDPLFDEPLPERGAPPGALLRAAPDEGRAVWLSGLAPTVEPPAEEPSTFSRAPAFRAPWWVLPRNHAQLAQAVRWTARGLGLQVRGPGTLAAEVRVQPARARLLVHLVHYDEDPARGLACRVRHYAFGPGPAQVFTPTAPEGTTVDLDQDGDWAACDLPPVERYALVEFPLASG